MAEPRLRGRLLPSLFAIAKRRAPGSQLCIYSLLPWSVAGAVRIRSQLRTCAPPAQFLACAAEARGLYVIGTLCATAPGVRAGQAARAAIMSAAPEGSSSEATENPVSWRSPGDSTRPATNDQAQAEPASRQALDPAAHRPKPAFKSGCYEVSGSSLHASINGLYSRHRAKKKNGCPVYRHEERSHLQLCYTKFRGGKWVVVDSHDAENEYVAQQADGASPRAGLGPRTGGGWRVRQPGGPGETQYALELGMRVGRVRFPDGRHVPTASDALIKALRFAVPLAAGENSVILLHPPLHLVGVSIVMWRERHQNDRTLADG